VRERAVTLSTVAGVLSAFSFITLATVGYGDIRAAIDATRAMAMTEAVTGQLSLVTVVARVVAMLPGRAGGGRA
jgi:voltage-gated potassium channel Kch